MLEIYGTINFPPCSSPERPGPPAGVFNLATVLRGPHAPRYENAPDARSRVGDRKARADSERGELIERITPRPPVRQFLLVELLGQSRVPFAGYRPDHRVGIARDLLIGAVPPPVEFGLRGRKGRVCRRA